MHYSNPDSTLLLTDGQRVILVQPWCIHSTQQGFLNEASKLKLFENLAETKTNGDQKWHL